MFRDWEIKISGTGGQGVVVAGEILCRGIVLKNYNASVIPSYGSQVKGGCVEVQIIISKDFIPAPFVSELNILCALSQIGYDNNLNLIKDETIVFYDDILVKEIKNIGKNIPIPAAKYCLENFNTTLPVNLFFVGVLAGFLKDYLEISHLEKILEEDKKLFSEINLKTLKAGYLYFKEKEVL
ncbi:MAG: 2-oxoacid:acceptor oxidoreductase family protein [candidate division WOR-3 bacterium]|nr:2-oxoacid:acceptor oxidoreductase family protein [candidate division WOR-3 bacterium]MCX7837571.1 2-oxoacid:acceptor oxidoreductase family protein [candidate division WOR-3 bacterium]MDW8114260.1 2-oxoacid:acceptor oxidoreductase family protein [candidate division WOR-3 bacterium]